MTHISKQKTPKFKLGIEEEYWLIGPDNNLIQSVPKDFHTKLKKSFGKQIAHEFLQSQVEIGTSPNYDIKQSLKELIEFRSGVSQIAKEFGMDIIASSTHPFADFREQVFTQKRRYSQLASDLKEVANRMLICGMHVHIGIDDNELKIDFMNQLTYFLPHILALTTSSPFYGGRDTGLLSYRLSVFDNIPRTGLPEQFVFFKDFEKYVDLLIKTKTIEDGTKIWWDIRPSVKWPTLETRICDICTNVLDTIAIASLIRCLFRFLYRMKTKNTRWRIYSNSLIYENRWRAQRYSFLESDGLSMIDFGIAESVKYQVLIEELFNIIKQDIEFYEAHEQMEQIKTILKRGTSANKQKSIFYKTILNGKSQKDAFDNVVNWLKKETLKTH